MSTTTTNGAKVIPEGYAATQRRVDRAVSELAAVQTVASPGDAQSARAVATTANKVLKAIDERRKELIRPHLDAQNEINAFAKELTEELKAEIQRVKAHIGEYEAEAERKRQEELRRIEAERRAKEEAERKERERVEALKERLARMQREGMDVVTRATNPDKLEEAIEKVKVADRSEEFAEFADEYRTIRDELIRMGEERVAFLREQAKQRAEAERLEGEARRQKEEEARQAAERQRMAAERERLAREAEARQRAEAEAKARREREAAEAAERERRQAELEAQRAKNLRTNWTFEVVDIKQVPAEFLQLDEKAVRAAIREHKDELEKGAYSIPGLSITRDQTVVLR